MKDDLSSFLQEETGLGNTIYPIRDDWFAAFRETPFEKVKVVILGQDPYFNEGQAHGLSFSVPKGVAIPPSLKNIYKELERDPLVNFKKPDHGCLLDWSHQGVLLLNASLTVRKGEAGSHMGSLSMPRWEKFTERALEALRMHGNNIVFLSWGKASEKVLSRAGITEEEYGQHNEGNHRLLIASHPSGLSAYRTATPFLDSKGISGCRHFSRANAYLEMHGRKPINWQL
jgi:uracil-DNA glycosylase